MAFKISIEKVGGQPAPEGLEFRRGSPGQQVGMG
jgi:hypothetical protein